MKIRKTTSLFYRFWLPSSCFFFVLMRFGFLSKVNVCGAVFSWHLEESKQINKSKRATRAAFLLRKPYTQTIFTLFSLSDSLGCESPRCWQTADLLREHPSNWRLSTNSQEIFRFYLWFNVNSHSKLPNEGNVNYNCAK